MEKDFKKILVQNTYFGDVDWYCLSRLEYLTEEFIRQYQDKVVWNYISSEQELSEDFIIEFKDKVNWCKISSHQKLSFKFIKQNIEKLNINKLLENIFISDSVKNKIKEFLILK